MIKVASYCRVSTDKEDQTNSFVAQKDFFRNYIRQHSDWELFRIYADEGITGTSTKKRVEFNRMIHDAYEGKFQLILTKEISRFSRNILDTIQYTRNLKARGIGVLFMAENLCTLDPESELLMTFMGTIAQEESRKTSQRVKWGQTRRMEQGIVFGTSLLGYDVKEGRLIRNSEGAEVVQLIFHKYAVEKKGTSVICRELEADGYCTSTGSTHWNPSHIIKILKNEKYAGDLIQKKSFTPDYLEHLKKPNHGEEPMVILRDHHEPIVSRELWDLAQQELAVRCTGRGGMPSKRYALSGKIKCGQCGASFVARSKRLQSGQTVLRWCCSTSVSQGRRCCDIGKQLRNEDAIEMVKLALHSLQLNRADILSSVVNYASSSIRLDGKEHIVSQDTLRKEIHRVEKKMFAVMDTYFSGDISREEMLLLKKRYADQLSNLHNKQNSVLEYENTKDILEKEMYQKLEMLLSRDATWNVLSKHVLERITVYKDRHMELKLYDLPHIFCFSEGN